MVDNVEFVVNNKVEILTDDGSYKSNIQDIGEEFISISIPVVEGKYLPLRRGEKVECVYYFKNNIYKFFTVVAGRKIDKIMLIMLAKPDKVVKIQRRNFVRVPLVSDVYCAILEGQPSGFNNNQIDFFNSFSLDISAGGIRLVIDKRVSLGNILMMTIPLRGENLALKGKVVRVEKDEQKRNVCGITFQDLDEKTREKIIKSLFQIMREQRTKASKGV